MSASSEHLKERVRLLQEELELKRLLLKKAELKSRARHVSASKENHVENCSDKRQASREKSRDPKIAKVIIPTTSSSPPKEGILTDLYSAVCISNVLLVQEMPAVLRLVCFLSSDHHLKLVLLAEGGRFLLIWDKALNPSYVESLYLIPSKRHDSSKLCVNLFLLERFNFSDISTLIFSVFVLDGLSDDEQSTVFCRDRQMVPFSAKLSRTSEEVHVPSPASCAFLNDEHSAIWIFVYVPSCMQYLVLTFSPSVHSEGTMKLVSSTEIPQIPPHLNPSWCPIIQSFNTGPLPHSFFAVHSHPDSRCMVGHCCSLESGSALQCVPFTIRMTDGAFGLDESIMATNLASFPLDNAHTLLSIVLSAYHEQVSVPLHVLFAVVDCADRTSCITLQVYNIHLPIDSPIASFTLLSQLPNGPSSQYLLHIAPTILAGRAYVNLFAWSLSELLVSPDSAAPVRLSSPMPADTPFFLSPTTPRLLENFMNLSQIGLLYSSHLRTIRVFGQSVR